jgi:hypothetical protein
MSTRHNFPALDGYRKAPDRCEGLTGKRNRQPTLVPPPVFEMDFTELEDGSLLETIEDPGDSSRSLLAVYQNGNVRFMSQFQSGDRVLVPIPRDKHILKHVRLPRGAEPYGSAASLLRSIGSIISQCLSVDANSTHILAHFVLSTWFIDQLSVAPYVALIGLPRSGKSTALSVLRLLCRRALLTADITSAAFYRACDRLTPTLLIDETNTAGNNRSLFHLLRTGTMRDVIALRKEESFRTFGAKVISWTELPNDAALNSRCILIPLHETHRADLKKPSDYEILNATDNLQKQLLQFRFEKHKRLKLSRIPGDEQLYSRTRDLYEALALPVSEDIHACNFLVELFKIQQESNREPLSPPQATVLHFLFYAIHWPGGTGTYALKGLATGVNALLKVTGERFQMSPREVGAALSSLGLIKRQRTRTGWMLWLDQETRKRIHELGTTYGFDHCAAEVLEEPLKRCDLCQNHEKLKLGLADDAFRTLERGHGDPALSVRIKAERAKAIVRQRRLIETSCKQDPKFGERGERRERRLCGWEGWRRLAASPATNSLNCASQECQFA